MSLHTIDTRESYEPDRPAPAALRVSVADAYTQAERLMLLAAALTAAADAAVIAAGLADLNR